ncbi:GspE/PulE family protein [Candidatus Parcubacteria bacterium]|nr:GspE/PulE family protein [Candidatus Parcubacteria bacterium]
MATTQPNNKELELEKKLSEIRSRGSEDQYKALAEKLGLPFSDLQSAPVDAGALVLITEEAARGANLAVILKNGKQLTVATTDPNTKDAQAVLESLKSRGYTLNVIITSPATLIKIWKRYESLKTPDVFTVGSIEIREEEIKSFEEQIKNLEDLKNKVSGVSTTQLLEILIAGALKTSASDIHFEPEVHKTRLRYRLDGVLNDVAEVDQSSYEKIVNRIKVLSKLRLNVHKTPQDGRFTIKLKEVDIEVRVSVLPSEYGETIVMRLLDPRTVKQKLEDLGMREDLLKIVKAQLDKPIGAILTTGPTGSGKTTTLYAFVNYLNSTGSKIITIEDPIEYHITGISQTQVDPSKGYTFANGLRAIVRQDPDIILVGEIRDGETAEIALQAALTGHLVLSTIHTNDSAGTVPRLIDLKINPQVIAPAIHVAMAQRLVRKLCPQCKKEEELQEINSKKITELLTPIKDTFKLSLSLPIKVYGPVGCKECNNTGYKGRTGVYEAFIITPELERLILSSPSISGIQALAVSQGMITMLQDAYLKLLEGVTSIEEIERILG